MEYRRVTQSHKQLQKSAVLVYSELVKLLNTRWHLPASSRAMTGSQQPHDMEYALEDHTCHDHQPFTSN